MLMKSNGTFLEKLCGGVPSHRAECNNHAHFDQLDGVDGNL